MRKFVLCIEGSDACLCRFRKVSESSGNFLEGAGGFLTAFVTVPPYVDAKGDVLGFPFKKYVPALLTTIKQKNTQKVENECIGRLSGAKWQKHDGVWGSFDATIFSTTECSVRNCLQALPATKDFTRSCWGQLNNQWYTVS